MTAIARSSRCAINGVIAELLLDIRSCTVAR
jgi:hypothetical protein